MQTSLKSKQSAAVLVFVLTMTTCAAPANGQIYKSKNNATQYQTTSYVTNSETVERSSLGSYVFKKEEPTMLEEIAIAEELEMKAQIKKHNIASQNTKDIKQAVKLTKTHISNTWYVFSGSTPSGWDCSGLVLWFYGNLNIELYHSATAQMQSGKLTTIPKLGDVVGFSWNGSSNYYHVGIYISEDLMLHAGGKAGDRTELRSISNFAGNSSTVKFSRIIDSN